MIRIHATSVTLGDCEARNLSFPPWLKIPMRTYIGILRPTRVRILGQEVAGEVEAVGKGVSRFAPGDQVFGATGFTFGGYAQYVCLPETADDSVVALKPGNVTFEEAAVVPVGGLEALHFMRKGNIEPGMRVLINGAGGSIGTFGVQLAKLEGAEVTAVDSAPKLEMLRSIGADHVIDYTQMDFTRNGQTYDIIFDVVGKSHFERSLAQLSDHGAYLQANPQLSHMFRGRGGSSGGKRVVTEAAGRRPEDLEHLRELVESGRIKPIVDRIYPLEQIVEAHRYVESGAKQGGLAITVDH
ncbi:MAG: NAD(P)-dependent alcohol dehydrogenase [Chloroflexota bacterium]